MSTYPEINPKDIKAGDTIERHWIGTVMTMPVARVEGRLAYSPEDYCMGLYGADGEKFFLIDRPAPPIELPEVPTLGILTIDDGVQHVGVWEAYRPVRDDELFALSRERDARLSRVTAFTPGSFVPTKALDELRAFNAGCTEYRHVTAFLDAINEANA